MLWMIAVCSCSPLTEAEPIFQNIGFKKLRLWREIQKNRNKYITLYYDFLKFCKISFAIVLIMLQEQNYFARSGC
jgi:hypothetical protein